MGQNQSANNSSNENSPVHRPQSQHQQQPPQRNSPSRRRAPDYCEAGGSGGGDLLLLDAVEAIGHEIRKQATQLNELSTFSFEDFHRSLKELNEL